MPARTKNRPIPATSIAETITRPKSPTASAVKRNGKRRSGAPAARPPQAASTDSGPSQATTKRRKAPPLDLARQSLDRAAKTEKQLRIRLKKQQKALDIIKGGLKDHDRELDRVNDHLKAARKARKKARKALPPES
jgi:hypothetical protein